MIALSAPDAISPAVRRMRRFLFEPFEAGTFLKLCLVALVTEGFSGNFNHSWSRGHALHRQTTITTIPTVTTAGPWTTNHLTPAWFAGLAAIVAISIVVALVLFYLITRLRFAYFHCLVSNTREIGPGWRLYRSQATRFFWMNLAVGLCFAAVIAVLALAFAAQIFRVIHEAGGHPAVGPMLALILPAALGFVLMIVAAIAVDLILRDFLLPHYALDNATAGEAWTASWGRFRAEPGAFVGYGLLRIFLPLVAWVGIVMILILPMIFTVAAVAVVEIGIHAAFAHGTGALPAEGIALQVVIGVIAAALTLLVWVGAGGPLNTAVREYALVFYGGRYQRLGDLLGPLPAAGWTGPGVS